MRTAVALVIVTGLLAGGAAAAVTPVSRSVEKDIRQTHCQPMFADDWCESLTRVEVRGARLVAITTIAKASDPATEDVCSALEKYVFGKVRKPGLKETQVLGRRGASLSLRKTAATGC